MEKNMIYLAMGGIYALLLFAVFFVVSSMDAIPPPESFLEPFMGPDSLIAIAIAAVSIMHLAWYHVFMFRNWLSNPRAHMLLLVLPETYAIFGFALGFFYMNPWASVPFVALGFANYAYAFIRIQAASQTM